MSYSVVSLSVRVRSIQHPLQRLIRYYENVTHLPIFQFHLENRPLGNGIRFWPVVLFGNGSHANPSMVPVWHSRRKSCLIYSYKNIFMPFPAMISLLFRSSWLMLLHSMANFQMLLNFTKKLAKNRRLSLCTQILGCLTW